METPKTIAGDLTEQIMRIFWRDKNPPVVLTTEQYNAIYSHVLDTLDKHFASKVRLDPRKMVWPGDEPLA